MKGLGWHNRNGFASSSVCCSGEYMQADARHISAIRSGWNSGSHVFKTGSRGRCCCCAALLILITGVAGICERKWYSYLHIETLLGPKFAEFCVISVCLCYSGFSLIGNFLNRPARPVPSIRIGVQPFGDLLCLHRQGMM